jgi:hypothetical protein
MKNQKETAINTGNHTKRELELFDDYKHYFEQSPISTTGKLHNFTKYVRRQDISRFLAKNELFKLQIDIPGSIVECGCFQGGGTMTFAQLSAIYEPYNHNRKVITFDTFDGFPSISEKDINKHKEYNKGDLFVTKGMEEEISQSVMLFDSNRPISHIPKIEFVKGDACIEIPAYLKKIPI